MNPGFRWPQDEGYSLQHKNIDIWKECIAWRLFVRDGCHVLKKKQKTPTCRWFGEKFYILPFCFRQFVTLDEA